MKYNRLSYLMGCILFVFSFSALSATYPACKGGICTVSEEGQNSNPSACTSVLGDGECYKETSYGDSPTGAIQCTGKTGKSGAVATVATPCTIP